MTALIEASLNCKIIGDRLSKSRGLMAEDKC